ncbi:MAG: prolipoprotein diacylglyceryl transferase [Bergeyella sp.]|nr:prolipoprotein diacylglyceryl transferase [Bergeyella sp.]
MGKLIMRLFLFFSVFFCFSAKSQEYKEGLSDGVLFVNNQPFPVKIFSTISVRNLENFTEKEFPYSILIITNKELNTYGLPLFLSLRERGYQFLDKKFMPTESLDAIKYLYKPKDRKRYLGTGSKVTLKTSFMIWDPVKGINLGFFTLYFYSLMYILAFGFGLKIMGWMFRRDRVDEKYLEPLLTLSLVGTVLGARLGHVIFYEPELFREDFWAVFLPFRTKPQFEFTGFTGLASHGAAIALLITTLYYSYRVIKKNPLWVFDRLGIVVALGGFFIRIGNFFNSEIIGKEAPENSFFSILFPQMSPDYGPTVPRYPTQLFEALSYLVLFFILLFFYAKTRKKYYQGWLFGLFLVLLWSIRFLVEFLKEPQGEEYISFALLNTGQVLSIPFIVAGGVLIFISSKFRLRD